MQKKNRKRADVNTREAPLRNNSLSHIEMSKDDDDKMMLHLTTAWTQNKYVLNTRICIVLYSEKRVWVQLLNQWGVSPKTKHRSLQVKSANLVDAWFLRRKWCVTSFLEPHMIINTLHSYLTTNLWVETISHSTSHCDNYDYIPIWLWTYKWKQFHFKIN
jgi:hypothetical protein